MDTAVVVILGSKGCVDVGQQHSKMIHLKSRAGIIIKGHKSHNKKLLSEVAKSDHNYSEVIILFFKKVGQSTFLFP